MATKCSALRCYRRGFRRRGHLDSNRHNSFFYIGLCNTTCFGLTRSHLQANETQQKLLCMLYYTNLPDYGFLNAGICCIYHPIYKKSCYSRLLSTCLSLSHRYLLLLPLALQPTVGFGLSNNVLPFFAICHQLSPSSHSQHLKISYLLPLSIFSWVFPFFSSLPVLE